MEALGRIDNSVDSEGEAHRFEVAFLAHCEQLRIFNKWTKSRLAREAFGGTRSASYRSYCRLLQVKQKAKPQRLTLHDAYMLALVFYPSFESFCFAVSEQLRNEPKML